MLVPQDARASRSVEPFVVLGEVTAEGFAALVGHPLSPDLCTVAVGRYGEAGLMVDAQQEQAQWIACWRCGNGRWATPSWCPTCSAALHPGPGRHETYRGPLVVAFPAVVPPARRPTSKRRALVVAVIVAASIAGIGSLLGRGGSSTAAALSAKACIDVVDAGNGAAAGTESLASFASTVRHAESDAETAASMDAKYEPILEDIVAVRNSIDTNQTSPASQSAIADLVFQCGPQRR